MRASRGVYEHQVPALDAAFDHPVVTNAQEKSVVRWNEQPVHRDEPLAIGLGDYRLSRLQPCVKRHRLRLADGRKSAESYGARSTCLTSDVPLQCQRLEDFDYGLRRFDAE